MDLDTLLPHFAPVRVVCLDVFPAELVLEARSSAAAASCPTCEQPSRRLHGSYTRHVADLPIGQRAVMIHLQVRRFRCQNAACPRRTFGERTPTLVAPYARRSVPLQTLLQDLGLTLGGRPGARFAGRHAVVTSRMTLMRRVRALPEPTISAPTVLGVDDFALRRGRRYGTILTDLDAHRVIDLLPDRSADAFAAWLTGHGQPMIICRDRGGDYASGARQGAPGALQIADRFHLQCNSSDVLERILARHLAALRATVTEVMPVPDADDHTVPAAATLPSPDPRRTRRLARYDQVIAFRREGWSLTAIAEIVGLSRPTVRKYVNTGTFPEWPARPTKLRAGTAHASYLQRRWEEGARDATRLWEELQTRGFTGSLRMVSGS